MVSEPRLSLLTGITRFFKKEFSTEKLVFDLLRNLIQEKYKKIILIPNFGTFLRLICNRSKFLFLKLNSRMFTLKSRSRSDSFLFQLIFLMATCFHMFLTSTFLCFLMFFFNFGKFQRFFFNQPQFFLFFFQFSFALL